MNTSRHEIAHGHGGRALLRAAVWLLVPVAGIALCGLGGATIGMLIGDTMGHPEGPGFVGFLYGLYIGAPAGALLGAFAAWRIDRHLRAG